MLGNRWADHPSARCRRVVPALMLVCEGVERFLPVPTAIRAAQRMPSPSWLFSCELPAGGAEGRAATDTTNVGSPAFGARAS